VQRYTVIPFCHVADGMVLPKDLLEDLH
jgi:hypothetical protein